MQAFPTFPRMQCLSVAVLTGAQCLVAGRVEAGDAAKKTPLQDYVSQKDDSFNWKQVNRKQVGGLSSVRLEFVSQTWRGHPWRHEMLIVRPTEARNPDIGFLLVSGDGGVDKSFELLRLLAVRAGATAAVINHVPNQPLYDGRKEDALIAYTFDQFLKSGDKTWPLLFPMVKSAVRGMDTVEAFAKKHFGNRLERFVVSGASKRGWTTWLTGAADPRVTAIAPVVIDTLNMKVQTEWAQQRYGRQSEEIQDYVELHLTQRLDDARTRG